MTTQLEIVLTPAEAFNRSELTAVLIEKTKANPQTHRIIPLKRSIDARGAQVKVRMRVAIVPVAASFEEVTYRKPEMNVSRAVSVIIIGAGPSGLFAALKLIELGLKPVVVERGSAVQARRRDLAAINRRHEVNPDSNYCFGEGGAGTYSDGKLYTRSTKRGDVRRILEVLVAHGASADILFDAHPHIGTNKLPKLIEQIRQTVLACGGEIHFNTRADDIRVRKGSFAGIVTHRGDVLEAQAAILATGHSARDMFALLHRKGLALEVKPFALGVRVEHPQELIDRIQYHCNGPRDFWLPPSSYSLTSQVNTPARRGVFSFCMCPGGFIVPAATCPGEVVVNGMSPSRRDSRFANSGIVASVSMPDFKAYTRHGPLAGMYFQAYIEQQACSAAGGRQAAPALRLTDFLAGKLSATLPDSSYQPGLTPADFRAFLPPEIMTALQAGFRSFGSKMRGYITEEAVVLGVESRTSSPVRIPRHEHTLYHPQLPGLFPCGEGAGYAGGIVSAAMDGERCAMAAANYIRKKI